MIPVTSLSRQNNRRTYGTNLVRAPLAELRFPATPPSVPGKNLTPSALQNSTKNIFEVILEDENGDIIHHKPKAMPSPKQSPRPQHPTQSELLPAFVLAPEVFIRPDPFDLLPDELVLHVISFVGEFSDFLSFSASSVRLRGLSNETNFWKKYHIKIAGPELEPLAAWNGDWKLSLVSKLRRTLPSGFNNKKSYNKQRPILRAAPSTAVPARPLEAISPVSTPPVESKFTVRSDSSPLSSRSSSVTLFEDESECDSSQDDIDEIEAKKKSKKRKRQFLCEFDLSDDDCDVLSTRKRKKRDPAPVATSSSPPSSFVKTYQLVPMKHIGEKAAEAVAEAERNLKEVAVVLNRYKSFYDSLPDLPTVENQSKAYQIQRGGSYCTRASRLIRICTVWQPHLMHLRCPTAFVTAPRMRAARRWCSTSSGIGQTVGKVKVDRSKSTRKAPQLDRKLIEDAKIPKVPRLLPSAADHPELKRIVSSSRLWAQSPVTRRQYFDTLSSFWGFNSLQDWYSVKTDDILAAPAGRTLLNNRFQGSLWRAVLEIYPEHRWEAWRFYRMPKMLLKDVDIQRSFFDHAAHSLGIAANQKERWYSIPATILIEMGGTFISAIYKSNLANALEVAYPDHIWHVWLFKSVPRLWWKSLDNQREFADWFLKEKLKSDSLTAWYNTSTVEVIRGGGNGWLKLYHNSFISALHHVFPAHPWEIWRFVHVPHNFWSSATNRRRYLEWLGEQMGFKGLDDYYRLTVLDFDRNHGRGFIYTRYTDNFRQALKDAFPEHHWDDSKFRSSEKPQESSETRAGPM